MRIGIGTKREDVVRFLEEYGLHASFRTDFGPPRIVGTAQDVGCPHFFGCGDEVMIEVTVDIDNEGNVRSEPRVEEMYTNCL